MQTYINHFSYVPLLPTKEAYEHRIWKGTNYQVNQIIDELTSKKWWIQGQVICMTDCATQNNKVPVEKGFGEVQYTLEHNHYIIFNNILELKKIVEYFQKQQIHKIKKIHINQTGYFISNTTKQ